MECRVQFLSCGYNGSGISALVSFDKFIKRNETKVINRILFNVGDSCQRICSENRIKLHSVSTLVVTSLSPHNLSGFAGMFLSLSDLGVGELTIYGPVGIRAYLDSMLCFINRKYPELKIEEIDSDQEVKCKGGCLKFAPVYNAEVPRRIIALAAALIPIDNVSFHFDDVSVSKKHLLAFLPTPYYFQTHPTLSEMAKWAYNGGETMLHKVHKPFFVFVPLAVASHDAKASGRGYDDEEENELIETEEGGVELESPPKPSLGDTHEITKRYGRFGVVLPNVVNGERAAEFRHSQATLSLYRHVLSNVQNNGIQNSHMLGNLSLPSNAAVHSIIHHFPRALPAVQRSLHAAMTASSSASASASDDDEVTQGGDKRLKPHRDHQIGFNAPCTLFARPLMEAIFAVKEHVANNSTASRSTSMVMSQDTSEYSANTASNDPRTPTLHLPPHLLASPLNSSANHRQQQRSTPVEEQSELQSPSMRILHHDLDGLQICDPRLLQRIYRKAQDQIQNWTQLQQPLDGDAMSTDEADPQADPRQTKDINKGADEDDDDDDEEYDGAIVPWLDVPATPPAFPPPAKSLFPLSPNSTSISNTANFLATHAVQSAIATAMASYTLPQSVTTTMVLEGKTDGKQETETVPFRPPLKLEHQNESNIHTADKSSHNAANFDAAALLRNKLSSQNNHKRKLLQLTVETPDDHQQLPIAEAAGTSTTAFHIKTEQPQKQTLSKVENIAQLNIMSSDPASSTFGISLSSSEVSESNSEAVVRPNPFAKASAGGNTSNVRGGLRGRISSQFQRPSTSNTSAGNTVVPSTGHARSFGSSWLSSITTMDTLWEEDSKSLSSKESKVTTTEQTVVSTTTTFTSSSGLNISLPSPHAPAASSQASSSNFSVPAFSPHLHQSHFQQQLEQQQKTVRLVGNDGNDSPLKSSRSSHSAFSLSTTSSSISTTSACTEPGDKKKQRPPALFFTSDETSAGQDNAPTMHAQTPQSLSTRPPLPPGPPPPLPGQTPRSQTSTPATSCTTTSGINTGSSKFDGNYRGRPLPPLQVPTQGNKSSLTPHSTSVPMSYSMHSFPTDYPPKDFLPAPPPPLSIRAFSLDSAPPSSSLPQPPPPPPALTVPDSHDQQHHYHHANHSLHVQSSVQDCLQVLFLGTGCATPSKHRSNSAILLKLLRPRVQSPPRDKHRPNAHKRVKTTNIWGDEPQVEPPDQRTTLNNHNSKKRVSLTRNINPFALHDDDPEADKLVFGESSDSNNNPPQNRRSVRFDPTLLDSSTPPTATAHVSHSDETKTGSAAARHALAREDSSDDSNNDDEEEEDEENEEDSEDALQSDAPSMLLDCGEGTAAQLFQSVEGDLVRFDQLLLSIKVIWISHHHADHATGLPMLFSHLQRAHMRMRRSMKIRSLRTALSRLHRHTPAALWNKYDLRQGLYSPQYEADKILLIASESVLKHAEFALSVAGLDDLANFYPITNTMYAGLTSDIADATQGLVTQLQSIAVQHCHNSFGLHFTLASGVRVVYSGDCRPSQSLVRCGRGCDLLIHEATFQDSLVADAVKKKHCTISEAKTIARQMQAKHLVLTHFSQRYYYNTGNDVQAANSHNPSDNNHRAMFSPPMSHSSVYSFSSPYPSSGPPSAYQQASPHSHHAASNQVEDDHVLFACDFLQFRFPSQMVSACRALQTTTQALRALDPQGYSNQVHRGAVSAPNSLSNASMNTFSRNNSRTMSGEGSFGDGAGGRVGNSQQRFVVHQLAPPPPTAQREESSSTALSHLTLRLDDQQQQASESRSQLGLSAQRGAAESEEKAGKKRKAHSFNNLIV